jgi:hypothetical protein
MNDCVYCLENQALRTEQVLCRGNAFYLCAPRGQLVEGYLAIAPYRCISCLAKIPRHWAAELGWFKRLVVDFYRDAYGAAQPIFYEQGRGGGGATLDPEGGFPLHAHLCSLPLAADLDRVLSRRFDSVEVAGLHALAAAVRDAPYLYVETGGQGRVYLARTAEDRAELERMRLKPMIAELLGLPNRGHWRTYPGDRELERVIRHFAAFRERRAA